MQDAYVYAESCITAFAIANIWATAGKQAAHTAQLQLCYTSQATNMAFAPGMPSSRQKYGASPSLHCQKRCARRSRCSQNVNVGHPRMSYTGRHCSTEVLWKGYTGKTCTVMSCSTSTSSGGSIASSACVCDSASTSPHASASGTRPSATACDGNS
jgi:hypothetical protein